MDETKELAVLVQNSGIEKTKAQTVLDSFTDFFKQASEWETKTKGLVITDVSQVAEMKLAREGRLQLKEIRVNAEKTKKKLKENILIEGRFIDSIYNLIEGVTKPLENDLLEKEKYVERIEQAKKDKLKADRIEKLAPYEIDSSFYNLEEMPEEMFAQLLENSRIAFEAKAEAQRKIEEERIAKEKAEQEERERIAIENAKLKAEAEAREKEIAIERAKIEDENKKREEAAQAERDRQAKELKKAQEQAEKARLELKAKQEAEEKAKRAEADRIESERLAKLEAEKKAAQAGDREKILAYISSIESISIPKVNSQDAKALIDGFIASIAKVKSFASTKL